MCYYTRNVLITTKLFITGKDVYELSIRNSADDERILLFKIRRSEQKMVEFKPKVGYVEPGQTTKVTLRLIDGSIPKTRLLVKLVVLKKSLLEQDFEQSWSVASQRNGEVKKVIDIVHTTSALGTQETAAANSTSVHSPLAHKRNSAKQLLLHRVRSTDSDACWDGASDTSSLSMQQSVTSAAFFSPSPSISAASTPKQSEFNRKQYTGNRFSPDERNQSEGPDTENGNGNFESPLTGEGEVRGGLHSNEYNFNDYEDMERDGYSVAESVADQSVDLHCFSESLSQSQQLQLQDATAALLRGNRSTTANVTGTANTTTSAPAPTTSAESSSAPTPSVATAATTAAATAADGAQDATAVVAVEAGQQKVLLEMLIKLSQTPNTATLLSQLLITAAASQNSASLLSRNHSANGPNLRTLNKPAPSTHQHSSSSAIPNLAAEQGKTFNNALSSPAFTSEQLSRFIEGEHAEFPSIRAASAEEKSESKSEAQDASPVLLASAEAGDEAELTDEQVQECSRLTTLSSADQRARRLRDLSSGVGGGDDMSMSSQSRGVGLRSAYLLELFGEPITNTTFAKVMECRMEQATVEKGKVVAVEVVSAGISDLSNTFGRVFSTAQVSAPAQSDPLDQLRTLRAAYLEDHLKHLTVNDCPRLVELDASLNRFRCLTVLNLSNCRIRTLSAPLNLPLLRSLDLSGNQLASLDYLQLLVSLTTLLAGGNLIASLNLSVNMLVSLSKSLVTLDLSANPVRLSSVICNCFYGMFLISVLFGRCAMTNTTHRRCYTCCPACATSIPSTCSRWAKTTLTPTPPALALLLVDKALLLPLVVLVEGAAVAPLVEEFRISRKSCGPYPCAPVPAAAHSVAQTAAGSSSGA